jgi:hypothetical protein
MSQTIAPDIRAYELWYEYLVESDKKKWTPEIEKDFAGVLTAKSFQEWFSVEVRLSLFPVYGRKPELSPVRLLSGKKDEAWSHNWLHRWDDIEDEEAEDPSNHLLVAINLDYPRALLIEKLDQLIVRKQGKQGAGRPKFIAPHSKYTFARRPDISSLEIALAAHILKKTGITNWEVGNELTKTFPILPAQRIKEGDLDSSDKQKVLESAASRYLKLAEAVLDGVTKGIFPAK